jgi:triacylglycerol esterase/lipase EstA (alpha/beta hydrolase family)
MQANSSALITKPHSPWWLRFASQVAKRALWFARQSREVVEKLHPDLREQLKELPLLAVTQLAPRATPELLLPMKTSRVTVFVHGYGGSRGNFMPMQSYFKLRGHTENISVGFGDTSSIECMADELKSTLHSLIIRNQLPQKSIDIVAHSLGGIISRVTLQDEELHPYVRTLVTLATPHAGSGLARYLDTPTCRGLRPGSELLQTLELQQGWGQNNTPKLVAFWTPKDCILIPADSARLDGAENICRPDCTHLSFLLRPSVWDDIIRVIEQSGEQARSSS